MRLYFFVAPGKHIRMGPVEIGVLAVVFFALLCTWSNKSKDKCLELNENEDACAAEEGCIYEQSTNRCITNTFAQKLKAFGTPGGEASAKAKDKAAAKAATPGEGGKIEASSFDIDYVSVTLDEGAHVSKTGRFSGLIDGKTATTLKGLGTELETNTTLEGFPYALPTSVTLTTQTKSIVSLKGSSQHPGMIQVITNNSKDNTYYIKGTITLVETLAQHNAKSNQQQFSETAEKAAKNPITTCEEITDQKECKDHCEWNAKTDKCAKRKREHRVTFAKGVTGGGKAQLRAVRDAIRQYEAQSGERLLEARRSFNRAKKEMA